ncbi:predicted protein [Uncinocarpus reesii 1704]|uniref:Uncharacterized protein n=1 Tax=Uncinocarpus reesii (strain UAMH 1704) TaxID=336963 RepID=C4JU30_UNCRE|nr:uncharacterized protein UREG_05969 [Uncinocarpus reesii 1704]EEP81127.1 predicted protein [Uncinocarpus reesii 1704]
MASVSKLRRILITSTLSVAIASGALYGASLKMRQDSKKEKIGALLVVREGLVRKKEMLEGQIREVEEREKKRADSAGGSGGGRRGG